MNISYPELLSFGFYLLFTAVITIIIGILLRIYHCKRSSILIIVLGSVMLAIAVVSITDLFYVAGYISQDGSCAWE